MNRKLIGFLLIIFILSIVLLAKDFIVKAVLERTIESLCGLRISTDSVEVGIFNTSIRVKGMSIFNPPSFPEKIMAKINYLYVNYDIMSGLKKEIHIREMVFDVGLVNVIKNQKGENNLNSIKIVNMAKEIDKCERTDKVMPKIRIDKLRLKGGKVVYEDYTKAPYPAVTEFMIPVDEEYKNISNPYELVSLIVSRSLVRTSPFTIIGFDITPLQNQFQGAVTNGVEALKKAFRINN